MGNQSKYYVLYRFDDGSSYKVEIGKDGVTDDDMRNLRNTIKVEYRANAKEAQLDAVSIEASFIEEDKHCDLIDESTDTLLIVETADEYDALHQAILQLPSEKRTLIDAVYFKGISAREYAKKLGISHTAVNKQLQKTLSTIKNIFGI